MSTAQEKISSLIETQFPAFYREDGPKFIAFVKAYYEWLELEGNAGERGAKLRDYRDIDKTIDDFIIHFKNKYLVDFPFTTTADKRSIIKKAIDIYRAKGSEAAVKLVFRLLFNEEVDVYLPGDDVIKPSDGTYVVPRYLELEPNVNNPKLIGKEITGNTSGAKAFVDRVDRRFYKGLYVDQVFISNIRGNFEYGEIITEDGDVDGKPKVIGSLTSLEIITPGRDFVVGEPLKLISQRKGRLGKVIVENVEGATGQVLFTIEDGGFGFVKTRRDINGAILEEGSDVYIARNMFGYANLTNSNTSITQFTTLEKVVQYKTRYTYTLSNLWVGGTPTVGDLVIGGNSSSNSATGYIASVSSNNQSVITSKENVFSTNGTIIDRLYAYVGPNVSFSAADVNISGNYVSIANNPFTNNQVVIYTTGNTVVTNLANNQFYYVVGANSTALSLSTSSGGAAVDLDSGGTGTGHFLYGAAIASHSGFSNAVDVSSYGYVTGQNSTHIGFHNLSGEVFNGFNSGVGVQNNYVKGLLSNTYAQLGRKYNGIDANFEIGSISNEERVYVATDFVGGNNYADGEPGPGIPYLNIKIHANTSNNDGYNSGVGSLAAVNVIDGGNGYVNGATLTLTGGNPVTNAAITVETTDSVGKILTINVVSTGYGYNSKPVISGGVYVDAANLLPVMFFGYGFPKYPYGGYNNIINECLTRETINVGTISVLSRVNPGEQYNISPFVYVIEPRIAGFNRKDLSINVSDITKDFIVGEYVQQNYFEAGHKVSFVAFTPGKSVGNVTITAAGQNYINNDPVFFIDATGTGALGKVTTNALGNVTSVSVTYSGRGFTGPTTANAVSGSGTGAAFTVTLANNDFAINETLYQKQFRTSLTISGWSQGEPSIGSNTVGYDSTPTEIANNGVILLANSTTVIIGSIANVFASGSLANVVSSNSTGGQTNAVITFDSVSTANIYGRVLSTNITGATGNAVIQFFESAYYSNTYAPIRGLNAFNNLSTITGITSAAVANINYSATEPNTITSSTTLVSSRGQVLAFNKNHASNTGVLDLKRLSFNLSFANLTLIGVTSGAQANIVSINNKANSLSIGLNAEIIANTSAANNTLSTARIVNSGIGYQQDEIITLLPEGNDRYVATARVNVENQGIAEGYFKNTQGFLNSDKYIHDNNYYQEYAYEVRSGMSLNRYASVLKQVLHVAGTKYFGNVVKIVGDILDQKALSQSDIAITKYFYSNNTSINSGTDFITIGNNVFANASYIFNNGDKCVYVRDSGNTADVGLVNNSVYYVTDAVNNGFKLKYSNGVTVNVYANTTSANTNEKGHSLTRSI